jgi:hypothetical protein
LQAARDPETGARLQFNDLLVNSYAIVYAAALFLLRIRVAASDTTAIALTFALYYIVAILEVWERLSEEIRSKFSAIEEITGQATATLPYLDAVIYECTLEISAGLVNV